MSVSSAKSAASFTRDRMAEKLAYGSTTTAVVSTLYVRNGHAIRFLTRLDLSSNAWLEIDYKPVDNMPRPSNVLLARTADLIRESLYPIWNEHKTV